jgi:hypothetical protein
MPPQQQHQVDGNTHQEFNDAPTYYQPTVIPQATLTLDQREAHSAFIEKLTSQYTKPEELRDLFMKPLPPNIGQVRTTITRVKSGLNLLFPKY